MSRNTSLADGSFLIALIALAGCRSSGQSLGGPDAAIPSGSCAVAEVDATMQTTPTLETGVDPVALAAAITPDVTQAVASPLFQSVLELDLSLPAE